MKWIHMADAHLGAWRDERLRLANQKAFEAIIQKGVDEQIDFFIISGDLFNTALPSIEIFREVTRLFKMIIDKGIRIYLIPGSHDYSPAGKTMISILETAGLCFNVAKGRTDEKGTLSLQWTEDKQTQTQLTGIVGKQSTLERSYYHHLNRTALEAERKGFSIFLFHSAISEFRPVQIKEHMAIDLSSFPKQLGYYAGGHVHYKFHSYQEEYGVFCYPGPVFPNSFSELEDLHAGSYCLVEATPSPEIKENGVISQDENHITYTYHNHTITMTRHVATVNPIKSVTFDCNQQNPEQIERHILSFIHDAITKDPDSFTEALVTLRLKGTLGEGKITELSFQDIFNQLYDAGALVVLKSTTQLRTPQFEEIAIQTDHDPEQLHARLIEEHVDQGDLKKRDGTPYERAQKMEFSRQLLDRLDITKNAGETNDSFEKRTVQELDSILRRKADDQ